jgi:hypothetical protein
MPVTPDRAASEDAHSSQFVKMFLPEMNHAEFFIVKPATARGMMWMRGIVNIVGWGCEGETAVSI